MKKIVFTLLFLCLAASQAQADIVFSTSGTDANAGTNLNVEVGQSASMFVWVSTNAGFTINGLNINILSSEADVLQATSHLIANPGGTRWNASAPGTLGDLATNVNAIALFAPAGLSTTGLNDFVLFSEVQFDATALGTTNLSFTQGANSVTYRGVQGQTAWSQWNAPGTGTVNVISAIPEPSSAAVLGLLSIGGLALRRRRS
jgi:hypothetical protein